MPYEDVMMEVTFIPKEILDEKKEIFSKRYLYCVVL